MNLQRELDRVIAGYPLMSELERHVILGLIEERLSAVAKSKASLRLITVDGAVLPGSFGQASASKKKFASLRG
jgi:hypothetical protein